MIAYKGFHPGLICRGYQFVMGLNTTEKQIAGKMDFTARKIRSTALAIIPAWSIRNIILSTSAATSMKMSMTPKSPVRS